MKKLKLASLVIDIGSWLALAIASHLTDSPVLIALFAACLIALWIRFGYTAYTLIFDR